MVLIQESYSAFLSCLWNLGCMLIKTLDDFFLFLFLVVCVSLLTDSNLLVELIVSVMLAGLAGTV